MAFLTLEYSDAGPWTFLVHKLGWSPEVFSWSLNFHRNAKIILLESECFQRVALVVLDTFIQNNSIPFFTGYAAINKG